MSRVHSKPDDGLSIPTEQAGKAVLAARQWEAWIESGACLDPWEGLALYQAAFNALTGLADAKSGDL